MLVVREGRTEVTEESKGSILVEDNSFDGEHENQVSTVSLYDLH